MSTTETQEVKPAERPVPTLSAAYPSQEIFASHVGGNAAYEVIKNGTQTFVFDHVDYPEEGGILLYLQGLLYPRKGFPFPEAIFALNCVKKTTLVFVFGFTNPAMLLPAIGFVLTPWKKKISIIERFLDKYTQASDTILAPYFLQERYYGKCAKEIGNWIGRFLENIGIQKGIADGVNRVFKMIIEYDNAYRQRLQDAFTYNVEFGRVSKIDFQIAPREVIQSLVKTIGEREPGTTEEGVWDKYNKMGKALSWLLYIPRIRKAFIESLEGVDFEKIHFDEGDEYHCMMYGDYNYFGKSIQERWAKLEEMHKGVVPMAHVIAKQP